jgi:hypothetical protein
MLARLGWIGTALATGLLLQIAVQINALHWLPDFPVYLGMAMLSAAVAVLAAPIAAVAAARGTQSPGKAPRWPHRLALAGFAAAAAIHAVLAARSSSSALEWWRNVALWPALLCGIAACVLASLKWQPLLFLWPLGESVASLSASWYAPSLGESQSLRAYQYVLIAALVSVLSLLPGVIAQPRWRGSWSLWTYVLASVALAVVCFVQPDTERAQPLMLSVGLLRLGLLVAAVNRWLKLVAADPHDGTAAQP